MSFLQLFDLCSFNILILVSLHGDGHEDVKPRCASQTVANGVEISVCTHH